MHEEIYALKKCTSDIQGVVILLVAKNVYLKNHIHMFIGDHRLIIVDNLFLITDHMFIRDPRVP